ALRTVIAMVLNRFLPGIGPMIAGFLLSPVAAGLARNDECEADAYASPLLVKAGIRTGPQTTLLPKPDTLPGPGGAEQAAWLLSHPKTAERIAAIEANEANWQSGR